MIVHNITGNIIIDTIAGVSSMNFLNMIIILYKVNKKINIFLIHLVSFPFVIPGIHPEDMSSVANVAL